MSFFRIYFCYIYTLLCSVCGGFTPVGGNGGSGGGYYNGNGIHRSLDVDTENADVDNDSLDLQATDSMVRKKRAAYQGAGGCSKIPQQKCNKIPHKIPRRQCSTVDKPSCHSKPRQVHKQAKWDFSFISVLQSAEKIPCFEVLFSRLGLP